MTMASWSGVLCKYWTCAWLKSQDDADTAAAEIREVFRSRPPDNDELITAIRWLAGPQNKHQEKCPTLRELIRAVAILRKQERELVTDRRQPEQSCAMCVNGWSCHYTGWARTWTERDYQLAATTAIPCRCTAGNRVMGLAKDYQDLTPGQQQRIHRMRDEAMEQGRARAK